MATDQPTGARYPAVVALLRRERANAEIEADFCRATAIAVRREVAYLQRLALRPGDERVLAYRRQVAADMERAESTRRDLVRQIDAALAGEGERDEDDG